MSIAAIERSVAACVRPAPRHTMPRTVPAAPAEASKAADVTLEGAVVPVDLRRVTWVLVAAAAALVVIGAVVDVSRQAVADADLARVLARFDLGVEPSVPTWFSSVVLLLDGLLLLLIARATRVASGRFAGLWLLLGLVFIVLSADEAAQFHEMIDTEVPRWLRLQGVPVLPWVLAAGAFAVLVAVVHVPLLLALPRLFAWLFLLAGALFVGGAVGMEIAGGLAVERFGVASLPHIAARSAGEALEMAGSILFFHALARYWTQTHGRARIVDA